MLHKAMARLLKNGGHTVEIAVNGTLGLDCLISSRSSFDLVLMDLQMPVMNGYEATKAYRLFETDHGLERIPIVGISANDVIAVRQLCIDAGMDEFLPKPFSLQELTACLNKLDVISNLL